ncbi:MAG: hypothetical protein HFE77_03500 [Clostridiales bacterium]|nr:hypothetical protein [Clostridiales bacterium]
MERGAVFLHFLAIVQFWIALGFLSFGYQITVHDEYNLIKKYREGKCSDAYAKHRGIIDLSFGILNTGSAVIIYCWEPDWSAVLLGVTMSGLILALLIHHAISKHMER